MQPGPTQFIGGFEITDCEFQIIRLLLRLKLRKLVADARNKSVSTIDQQLWILYRKLGIKKITDLIIWALDNGFDSDGNFTRKPPKDIPIVDRHSRPAGKPKKKKKR